MSPGLFTRQISASNNLDVEGDQEDILLASSLRQPKTIPLPHATQVSGPVELGADDAYVREEDKDVQHHHGARSLPSVAATSYRLSSNSSSLAAGTTAQHPVVHATDSPPRHRASSASGRSISSKSIASIPVKSTFVIPVNDRAGSTRPAAAAVSTARPPPATADQLLAAFRSRMGSSSGYDDDDEVNAVASPPASLPAASGRHPFSYRQGGLASPARPPAAAPTTTTTSSSSSSSPRPQRSGWAASAYAALGGGARSSSSSDPVSTFLSGAQPTYDILPRGAASRYGAESGGAIALPFDFSPTAASTRPAHPMASPSQLQHQHQPLQQQHQPQQPFDLSDLRAAAAALIPSAMRSLAEDVMTGRTFHREDVGVQADNDVGVGDEDAGDRTAAHAHDGGGGSSPLRKATHSIVPSRSSPRRTSLLEPGDGDGAATYNRSSSSSAAMESNEASALLASPMPRRGHGNASSRSNMGIVTSGRSTATSTSRAQISPYSQRAINAERAAQQQQMQQQAQQSQGLEGAASGRRRIGVIQRQPSASSGYAARMAGAAAAGFEGGGSRRGAFGSSTSRFMAPTSSSVLHSRRGSVSAGSQPATTVVTASRGRATSAAPGQRQAPSGLPGSGAAGVNRSSSAQPSARRRASVAGFPASAPSAAQPSARRRASIGAVQQRTASSSSGAVVPPLPLNGKQQQQANVFYTPPVEPSAGASSDGSKGVAALTLLRQLIANGSIDKQSNGAALNGGGLASVSGIVGLLERLASNEEQLSFMRTKSAYMEQLLRTLTQQLQARETMHTTLMHGNVSTNMSSGGGLESAPTALTTMAAATSGDTAIDQAVARLAAQLQAESLGDAVAADDDNRSRNVAANALPAAASAPDAPTSALAAAVAAALASSSSPERHLHGASTPSLMALPDSQPAHPGAAAGGGTAAPPPVPATAHTTAQPGAPSASSSSTSGKPAPLIYVRDLISQRMSRVETTMEVAVRGIRDAAAAGSATKQQQQQASHHHNSDVEAASTEVKEAPTPRTVKAVARDIQQPNNDRTQLTPARPARSSLPLFAIPTDATAAAATGGVSPRSSSGAGIISKLLQGTQLGATILPLTLPRSPAAAGGVGGDRSSTPAQQPHQHHMAHTPSTAQHEHTDDLNDEAAASPALLLSPAAAAYVSTPLQQQEQQHERQRNRSLTGSASSAASSSSSKEASSVLIAEARSMLGGGDGTVCDECHALAAMKACLGCSEAYWEGCFSKLHASGRRKEHAWSPTQLALAQERIQTSKARVAAASATPSKGPINSPARTAAVYSALSQAVTSPLPDYFTSSSPPQADSGDGSGSLSSPTFTLSPDPMGATGTRQAHRYHHNGAAPTSNTIRGMLGSPANPAPANGAHPSADDTGDGDGDGDALPIERLADGEADATPAPRQPHHRAAHQPLSLRDHVLAACYHGGDGSKHPSRVDLLSPHLRQQPPPRPFHATANPSAPAASAVPLHGSMDLLRRMYGSTQPAAEPQGAVIRSSPTHPADAVADGSDDAAAVQSEADHRLDSHLRAVQGRLEPPRSGESSARASMDVVAAAAQSPSQPVAGPTAGHVDDLLPPPAAASSSARGRRSSISGSVNSDAGAAQRARARQEAAQTKFLQRQARALSSQPQGKGVVIRMPWRTSQPMASLV